MNSRPVGGLGTSPLRTSPGCVTEDLSLNLTLRLCQDLRRGEEGESHLSACPVENCHRLGSKAGPQALIWGRQSVAMPHGEVLW